MIDSVVTTPLAEVLFNHCLQVEAARDLACERGNQAVIEKFGVETQLAAIRRELSDRDDVIGFLESEVERLKEQLEMSEEECDNLCDQINHLSDKAYDNAILIGELKGQLSLQGHDDSE